MNECHEGRKKFALALAEWVLKAGSDAPPLHKFNICRGCSLAIFNRVVELTLVYSQDAIEIVNAAQDQIEAIANGQALPGQPVTGLKH